MTITLDKIKEMNLQVGTPIEIVMSESRSLLGYFHQLDKGIIHVSEQNDPKMDYIDRIGSERKIGISQIKEIKVLEYKK